MLVALIMDLTSIVVIAPGFLNATILLRRVSVCLALRRLLVD